MKCLIFQQYENLYTHRKGFFEQSPLRITLIHIIFNYMKNVNRNNIHTRLLDS